MFIRKYWIPLSVFIVAIVGIGLYLLATQPPKEPIVIYKPVEPIEKPTQQPKETEVPEGDTSQGGHVHADGTWHEGPHEEMPSDVIQSEDVNFDEIDAESKARAEKADAEIAASKTAREFNEAWMREMEASPYFHLHENVYNFLKANPDFSYAIASPELLQKRADAVYADVAKAHAYNAEQKAEYERNRYKDVDMSPFIPHQGGNR
ncbi:hypothetical protein F4009_00125 [Candidatus Poribacteria bacterium]|nr:hypothetical protein [Candidatus Poribacteria bacterium]MYH83379.1 hypothetical protein [Candidatus Poribacteria bacterium]MYK92406.1 hypothetical protein [Candidatus Poribacteria bacterium]